MQDTLINRLKNSASQWHEKYAAYLPAVFFGGGFLLDILTLGEIDELSNMLILSLYLILAVTVISFEYLGIEELKTEKAWLKKAFEYRDDAFHFFLGALLSAFTLFYFKSSSLSNSFFFMLIMMALLLLNETSLFQKRGIIIRSILIKLSVVSYLILLLPTLIGQANSWIFALCILMAIGLSSFAFWLLSKNLSDKQAPLKNLLYPQLAVVGVFVFLYLAKILPPVPLSVKSMAIYYNVEKAEGNYTGYSLTPSWKFWRNGDQAFKYRPKDKVYIATNVFSPAGFEGKVYMRWMKHGLQGWQTSDRIPLKIWGGRKGGFRGYSYKSNYTEGEWQVRLETEDELEIGRISFSISKDKEHEDRIFRAVKL